ncbi:MAG: carbohydrate ABC transporter permease [Chloroflexales bacterium]|nr:carbohydrate ABC transporter permease [Chloroflexales bacterium]
MATHTQAIHERRASDAAQRRAVWRALSYALLVGGALLMLFPFIWMALGSFKDLQESNRFPPTLVPERWHPENYVRAWTTPPSTLGRYVLNSLIIAVAGTGLQLVICTLAGYAFAMLRFRGRELLFLLVLATTMIPGEVTLIPNFVTIRRFPLLGGNDLWGAGGSGLYDTYAAMILPGLAGAFNIFLLRQAFRGVPREYWEAAQIDGCSGFDYLRRVMVPLALPTLLTVAVFGFIGRWNGLLWPLIITRSEALRPVQVAMTYYQSEYVTDYGMLMAASLIVTAPIVALFMLVQRQFIAGVMSAGIKG